MRKVIFIYLVIFLSFSLLFLTLFHLPILHNLPVLFYRGLFFLTFTTLFFLTVIFFLKIKKNYSFNLESLVSAVILSFAIHLSIFVVFPVTIERSITTYILNTLKESEYSQQCQGLSKDDLEQKLIDEYIIERGALDKRISEQKIIDFVNAKDDCVQVTRKALNFLDFTEIMKKIYALN